MPSIMDEEIKNLQLDRPGRGKSPEQLKRHSLHENFESKPVDRALYLLTKGDEVQKISIIQALPQLVQIDENATYNRILPKIQQELPTSSCEFHINASKIFQQFLEKPKAPSNLLAAVLQGIESRDLIVVNAWLETLIAVIPTLNDDSIRKEIMPIAMTKAALTQPVMSRIAACSILGKVAIHPKFKPLDIKKDVLPIVQSLCQDVQPEVRAAICIQLPNVAQGLGEQFVKAHLLSCLVELASDSNPHVRSAAISSTVLMLPNISAETKKCTIVPLVKKLFERATSVEDATAGTVAKEIGILLQGLLSSLSVAETVNILQCYKTLAHRGISTRTGDARFGDPSLDVICRDRCAYNLPAVLQITVTVVPDQTEAMYGIFRELASDPCYIVRRTVGGCIHEIARILGTQNKMMKTDIVRLLRDDAEEVLQTLVPNIGTTLVELCKSGILSKEKADQATMEIGRAMLKCQLELTKGYNWRLLSTYLAQLERLPQAIPSDFIHQHFTPVVLSNALNGRARPVRSQAVRTLLVFLRQNSKENQQKWLRDSLISELCYSNSSYTRRMYVILCGHALEIFNEKYVKDHFLIPLISLADDPVSNIRYMFVNLLPQINKILNTPQDSRLKQLISDAVGKLDNQEKDVDVVANLRKKLKASGDIDKGKKEYTKMSITKLPVGNNIPAGSGAHKQVAPSRISGSARNSPKNSPGNSDMSFLEQHFYIDAGVNLPKLETTDNETYQKSDMVAFESQNNCIVDVDSTILGTNIDVQHLTPVDVKALENSTTNITDDLKVNLRNISRKAQSNLASCSNSIENRDINRVNKRHSSIFSSSCLENQTKKASNRRSLNIQAQEASRIPISSAKSTRSSIPRSERSLTADTIASSNKKCASEKVIDLRKGFLKMKINPKVVTEKKLGNSPKVQSNGVDISMKENLLPTTGASKLPVHVKSVSNLPLYIGRQSNNIRKK